MSELKNVLVTSTFAKGIIAIIEINDEFIEIINKITEASKFIEKIGIKNSTIKIEINININIDFYEIRSTHKKRFDNNLDEYHYGSFEYFSLTESERIDLKKGNDNIDWNIISINYETIIIGEDSICGFIRKFTENNFLLSDGKGLNFECGDNVNDFMSETVSITELFEKIKLKLKHNN